MKEIETFKTVHLFGNFSDDPSETIFNINIPFEVDEIILKYVTFYNNAGGTPQGPDGPELCIVKSNLINDIVFSFPLTRAFFEGFNTPFKTTTRRIQGDYEFKIVDGITGSDAEFTNFKMTLVFVFVKHRD